MRLVPDGQRSARFVCVLVLLGPDRLAQVFEGRCEGVLCREGLGIAVETKGLAETDPAARQKGLEEAHEWFVRMQPAEDGPRRAYSIYHQGRIKQLLGK